MFQQLTNMAGQLRTLILAIAVVVWLGATLAVAVTRRSVLSAAGVFIAGAFLVWGMANADWLRDKAGQDIQAAAPTPAVALVFAGPVAGPVAGPAVGGVGGGVGG